jgi:putative transposase
MAVSPTVTDAEGLGKELMAASPDLLGSMVKAFAEALMGAEVDGICGADYGEVSADRTNRRNGYRLREWDTRAGTVEVAIPKLRQGSYFPEWLLTRRRRAEQALISVVATSYLLGVSTRRVDKLVEQLGVAHISKSQVSELARRAIGDRTSGAHVRIKRKRERTLRLRAEGILSLSKRLVDDGKDVDPVAVAVALRDP